MCHENAGLPSQENRWLKNYFHTSENEQTIVCLNKEKKYTVRFLRRGQEKREDLILKTLPAVVELLQKQRTPSYRVRRRNLPWRDYAFILACLDEGRVEEGWKILLSGRPRREEHPRCVSVRHEPARIL